MALAWLVFIAILFDVSLIFNSGWQQLLNWNLTLIKVLGIIVAVHYAVHPCEKLMTRNCHDHGC